MLAPSALGAPASLDLSVSTSGTITVALDADMANGSALRYAMDGNFTPLIDSLPVNASQRASLLSEIALAESSFLSSSYFGNHDGNVSAGEVTLFESLINNQAKLLPTGSITGAGTVVLALNGVPATNGKLTGIDFSGAVGPDTSSAPITVSSGLAYTAPYGSGSQNLTFGVHLPSLFAGVPGTSAAAVEVAVSTPVATTISSATGLSGTVVSNDLLGWGSASASGSYAPAENGTVTILFHPSFPTGDVVIGAAVVAGLAGVALVLLRRHRRARASRPSPPPSDEKVGPSGSA